MCAPGCTLTCEHINCIEVRDDAVNTMRCSLMMTGTCTFITKASTPLLA